jgi:hypothetical protein
VVRAIITQRDGAKPRYLSSYQKRHRLVGFYKTETGDTALREDFEAEKSCYNRSILRRPSSGRSNLSPDRPEVMKLR